MADRDELLHLPAEPELFVYVEGGDIVIAESDPLGNEPMMLTISSVTRARQLAEALHRAASALSEPRL